MTDAFALAAAALIRTRFDDRYGFLSTASVASSGSCFLFAMGKFVRVIVRDRERVTAMVCSLGSGIEVDLRGGIVSDMRVGKG